MSPAPDDHLDGWREPIAECAGRARLYADMVDQYASIRDDVGLAYAMRCLVAAVSAGADLAVELKKDKARLGVQRAATATEKEFA